MRAEGDARAAETGWGFFDRLMRATSGARLFLWWGAASVTTVISVAVFLYLLAEQAWEPASQMAIALAVLFYTGNPAVKRLIGAK